MYESTIAIAELQDEGERAQQLRLAVAKLPFERYAVLRYVVEFLTDVQLFAATNQMTSSNLSIIFGPALLHPRDDAMASAAYLNQMPVRFCV